MGGNLPGILETFRDFFVGIFTGSFGNFPGFFGNLLGILETFWDFWKLSGVFLEIYQDFLKVSGIFGNILGFFFGNLPGILETFRDFFFGEIYWNFWKLSGNF